MDKVAKTTSLLLHSSVDITITLIDVMVAKKVISAREGAAILLKYSDDMAENAEKIDIYDLISPHVNLIQQKITHLHSLK